MGTRSNIGIRNDDNSITAIYCHWDGYPEHVGKILLNHYNSVGIVNELMDLGDLSILAENLYSDNNSHTFNNPQPNVCVAYGRDRGEKGVECKVFNDSFEFERFASDTGAEYQYLFDNGKWTYRKVYKGTWKELTSADCA
jgi:hypothetical protein